MDLGKHMSCHYVTATNFRCPGVDVKHAYVELATAGLYTRIFDRGGSKVTWAEVQTLILRLSLVRTGSGRVQTTPSSERFSAAPQR